MEMSAQTRLTQHLRHVLSCTRNSKPEHLVSHQECINREPRLAELAASLLDDPVGGPKCSRLQLFCVGLVKKIILAHFLLLCVCNELQDDVEYAFAELRVLFEFAQHYMMDLDSKLTTSLRIHCNTTTKLSLSLELTEFADVLVSSHSNTIAEKIMQNPSPDNLSKIARFECCFVKALLGICATYTSLMAPPAGGKTQQKLVFVSEEMFSLVQHSHRSWLDCLIPGAQSEKLRAAEKQLTSCIWKQVATKLLKTAQPMTVNETAAQEFVGLLTAAKEHPDCLHHAHFSDLEHHCAVRKCLWFTVSRIEQQQNIALWDSSLQPYLATMPFDLRKGLKPNKDQKLTRSTSLLLSQVLPSNTLSSATSGVPAKSKKGPSPSAVAQHVDVLSLGESLAPRFETTISATGRFILQGLQGALATWNLRTVAHVLFVEGPEISDAFTQTASLLARRVCPVYSFPMCSSMHAIECSSREGYSLAHDSYMKFKESIEWFTTAFHNAWSEKCMQIIGAVFPSRKFWKSFGKRSQTHQPSPSAYSESIVEHIALPVVEAASTLPEEAQKAFVGLSVFIFMNELRKTITANKNAYNIVAGRQLLTDFRHLWQWLTSNEHNLLCKATCQLLASLPIANEIEHGLLIVCGISNKLELQSQQHSPPLYSLLHYPHLPVFVDSAWHTEQDWTQCIL